MREILFRGKRVDNGEWVVGDSLVHSMYKKGDVCIGVIEGLAIYSVIPESVSEFTGLTDKNGKKIFEGDIVTNDYCLEKDKTKNSIIEYGKWNCSCCNGVFGWVSNGFVDFRDEDVIVIGNIHDNPELLKGENDA